MDATVRPSRVSGVARAPGSKSYSHRAVLAAGYAAGAVVRDPLVSADTRATVRAVEAFGGQVEVKDGSVVVEGFSGRPGVPGDVIDCGNSGTTLRLVAGASALVDGVVVLTGDGSLRSRPNGPLLEAITDLGGDAVSTRGNGQAPLVIGGPVAGGRVVMPGDVSSQFITALLMAGAVTSEGVEIELSTGLKSAPYVDITREVLGAFGVEARATDGGFVVPGGQAYVGPDDGYVVPGDFSSISYLVAAGVLAGEDGVVIERALPSAQGDTAILEVVRRMGGRVEWDEEAGVVRVERSALEGVRVDVGDTPDLLPTIAVLGAAAGGRTRIENAGHVRLKETDRVAAMAAELEKLGVRVSEEPEALVVYGEESALTGATVDGWGDHRIVMALSVAGLVADGVTRVRGAEHVDVSFPGFFDVLAGLGADLSVE